MTFGYSKESENISLNRMLNGYIDKEGNLVYKGVGLDKKTLLNTLRSLSKNKIIIKKKRYSKEKGCESINYKLNFIMESWRKKYPCP